MTLTPPWVATWLLNKLISGPNRDSLIGDLVERYQDKRSRSWYWRQTIVAVVGSFAVDAWRRRWIMTFVIAVSLMLPEMYLRFLFHTVAIVDSAWYPQFSEWLARSAPTPTWRVIMQLHPWALTGTVAWCVLLGSVSSFLVRADRDRRGLILTAFILANVGQCVPYLQNTLKDWIHNPLDPIWMFNCLWYWFYAVIAMPFSILIGGRLWTSVDSAHRASS